MIKSNDQAWEVIFDNLRISEALGNKPYYEISADQIKKISAREPRLMAKFDTKESLPNIFKKGELNINAVSNGNYIIFRDPSHRSFIKLPDYKEIVPKKITPSLDFSLETLVFNTRMSESNAIDFAHHSKILSKYSGEKDLKLTTRGRFYSDNFNFQLGTVGSIGVKGVQIEVDAGFEGLEQFLIIEAKSSTRDTFNIRQLYYPFRHFQTKTRKKIRTILLSFSNGVYYFTEIELFPEYYDYKILSNEAYEIVIREVSETLSIEELLSQETHKPTGIPVPQADDLNKVIDLITFLVENPADKFSIAEHFEFHERQGDYYGNACSYIGFTKKEGTQYKLTAIGEEVGKINNRENRNKQVIKAILRTKLFNDLLRLNFKQDKIDDQQIIDRLTQEELTGTTPERRKSTVKSWINWIINVLINK